MAALVQTIPQQSASVAMIPGRPSSSSGGFSPSFQPPSGVSRNSMYNPSTSGYRGLPSYNGPVQYSYTPVEGIGSGRQIQTPHLRPENRTSSAPVVPYGHMSGGANLIPKQHYPAAGSMSNNRGVYSRDDTSLNQRQGYSENRARPKSTIDLSTSSTMLSAHSNSSQRPSPDRYHRNSPQRSRQPSPSAIPSGSGMGGVSQLYSHPGHSNSLPSLHNYQSFRGQTFNAGSQTRITSVDDMSVPRTTSDMAKRYRRRSMGSMDPASYGVESESPKTYSPHPSPPIQYPARTESREWKQRQESPQRSPHTHNGSTDSVVSTRSTESSSRPSSRRDSSSTASTPQGSVQQAIAVNKQEVKIVNVPPRTPDASKRTTNPSPLSQPMTMSPDAKTLEAPVPQPTAKPQPAPAATSAGAAINDSPAARQLAALGKKDDKKKSKLRRAFSFGSASELRKATAQAHLEKEKAVKAARRTSKYEDELPPEEAAIAQRQEEAGLGESIYSGQGHFFTGSTDNLSISSTASSASIMLRKMGKGVKKSTKSLVGLFRPKSVIGVPAADGPIMQPSVAEVSMVTVEAEREKVNVNADPHEQAGGGTGFPKLNRNSLDAAANASVASSASTEVRSRRSIVGGEKERAEVLAAVRKGILKRTDSGQSSPAATPYTFKVPDFNLPQIPHVNDSPGSSAPSTPGDDQPPRSGHRRTDSVAIEGLEHEDYFSSITRFASMEAKDSPSTARNNPTRNISFSPRIQFHDTWTSTDYDRRGEIATCNRLTPMLAQQIKEELNTFKMEMEVHETSKIYTHFF